MISSVSHKVNDRRSENESETRWVAWRPEKRQWQQFRSKLQKTKGETGNRNENKLNRK